MLNSMGLGFVFTARDLASSSLMRLERNFLRLDGVVGATSARMSAAFAQLGAGIALMAGGGLLIAGALDLANAAGRFEQQLAAVGSVTRATTAEMQMLRDAAIEAGMVTQFSPDEAVSGLTTLATAGQTATQAVQTLLPVLDLAAGSLGQLTVDQAADAIVGTLNAYGLAATEATNVTDRLLRITQLTNFQTRDFEGGLAKAAATGAVFGQSLDDVLITLGLLRNRNIDASSSGTAFREATRRVGGEMRAMNALGEAGIDIFDAQSGRMRSIVDIMLDFHDATVNMTEAERNNRINVAFGARGMLAYNAVMNASFTTMRDGVQVTLMGRDAIAAMRAEMTQAGGTALDFRERLADTFEGQKTLLRGVLQTIAVTLGEPLTQVLKPVVMALVKATSAIVAAIEATPAPLKRMVAGGILVAGALLSLVGGAIVAKAAITLFGIAMGALGMTATGVLSALLPAVGIVAALGLLVAGFAVAYRNNLGGIGDFSTRLWERVRLFFGALRQLFEDGGFSGAVMEELNRAENAGLKRFVIGVWQVIYRLQQAWSGLRSGFEEAIGAAAPAFAALRSAFTELGGQVLAIVGALTGSAAGLPSASFRTFGAIVGVVLGGLVEVLTHVLTWVARLSSGVLIGMRSAFRFVGPALDQLVEAFGGLGRALGLVAGTSDGQVDLWSVVGTVLKAMGVVVGWLTGLVLMFAVDSLRWLIVGLTTVVNVVGLVSQMFVDLGVWLGETAARIVLWFAEDVPNAVRAALEWLGGLFEAFGAWLTGFAGSVVGLFGRVVEAARTLFAPIVEFFGGIAATVRAFFEDLVTFVLGIVRQLPQQLLPEGLQEFAATPFSFGAAPSFAGVSPNAVANAGPVPSSSAMPSVVEHRERQGMLERLLGQSSAQSQAAGDGRPIQVSLEVDGETLARVTSDANRRRAVRSFAPVPSL